MSAQVCNCAHTTQAARQAVLQRTLASLACGIGRRIAVSARRRHLFALRSASLDALHRKLRERCTFEELRLHGFHATSLTLLGKMVGPMMLARISGPVDLAGLVISCDQKSAEVIEHAVSYHLSVIFLKNLLKVINSKNHL